MSPSARLAWPEAPPCPSWGWAWRLARSAGRVGDRHCRPGTAGRRSHLRRRPILRASAAASARALPDRAQLDRPPIASPQAGCRAPASRPQAGEGQDRHQRQARGPSIRGCRPALPPNRRHRPRPGPAPRHSRREARNGRTGIQPRAIPISARRSQRPAWRAARPGIDAANHAQADPVRPAAGTARMRAEQEQQRIAGIGAERPKPVGRRPAGGGRQAGSVLEWVTRATASAIDRPIRPTPTSCGQSHGSTRPAFPPVGTQILLRARAAIAMTSIPPVLVLLPLCLSPDSGQGFLTAMRRLVKPDGSGGRDHLGGGLVGLALAAALDSSGLSTIVIDPADPAGRMTARSTAGPAPSRLRRSACSIRSASAIISRSPAARSGGSRWPMAWIRAAWRSIQARMKSRSAGCTRTGTCGALLARRSGQEHLADVEGQAGRGGARRAWRDRSAGGWPPGRSAVLVAAEGRNSPMREAPESAAPAGNMIIAAIVSTLRHERPHDHVAYEIFYPSGRSRCCR